MGTWKDKIANGISVSRGDTHTGLQSVPNFDRLSAQQLAHRALARASEARHGYVDVPNGASLTRQHCNTFARNGGFESAEQAACIWSSQTAIWHWR